jgi:hypothetical protein
MSDAPLQSAKILERKALRFFVSGHFYEDVTGYRKARNMQKPQPEQCRMVIAQRFGQEF